MNKFPHVVPTNYQWTNRMEYIVKLNEIRAWLTENVGEPYNDWVTGLGRNDCLEVRFTRESDAVWFIMRWE